jgi:L-ribulose-5-phosphate 3-epimerase UlaE
MDAQPTFRMLSKRFAILEPEDASSDDSDALLVALNMAASEATKLCREKKPKDITLPSLCMKCIRHNDTGHGTQCDSRRASGTCADGSLW